MLNFEAENPGVVYNWFGSTIRHSERWKSIFTPASRMAVTSASLMKIFECIRSSFQRSAPSSAADVSEISPSSGPSKTDYTWRPVARST